MNGPAFEIVTSAAVIRGEFGRAMLALVIVGTFCLVCWAIQEFGSPIAARALAWLRKPVSLLTWCVLLFFGALMVVYGLALMVGLL